MPEDGVLGSSTRVSSATSTRAPVSSTIAASGALERSTVVSRAAPRRETPSSSTNDWVSG